MVGPGKPDPIAKWREGREWWVGSPQLEFTVEVDGMGIRRQNQAELPTLGEAAASGQKPLSEDHTEEIDLRVRKIRDPLASSSHGRLPKDYRERQEHAKRWAEERLEDALDFAIQQVAWSVAVRAPNEPLQVGHDVDRWGFPKRRISCEVRYAPLHVLSGYAFGRSTILAEEIAALAVHGGCPAVAISDPHSLTGAVEHAKACNRVGIKPLIGTSIELPEGGEIVLIARTKRGYVSLSRLVTECHLGEPRGFPLGSWERLERHAEDLICLTGGDLGPVDRHLIRRDTEAARRVVERLVSTFGRRNVFLEVERSYLPWSLSVGRQILALADELRVLPVAGGAITHGRKEHFPAQDTLVCAHTLCLIEDVIGRKEPRDPSQPQVIRHPERALNAERYMRPSDEMAALFADRPDLLENTLRVVDRCDGDVLPGRMALPTLFEDDAEALRQIVDLASQSAYAKMTKRHRVRLDMELERIIRLGYAGHFVVAWDMTRWAREQGIQMSGRGSVVDSAVAYVLGLSRIDAIVHRLHFDRFLPDDGAKRPDIDIDFEAKRRDDVRGYLVGKYGVERVAAVAAIGAYGTRGIVREVGKVFGIPQETIGFLAKRIHGGVPPDQLEAALDKRPELRDSNIPREKFRWVMRLAERMMDIPRNMRLHSSGVIVSSTPIRDTVPVMWSAAQSSEESGREEDLVRMMQWDKRSAKHFGDKYDILCLRGQDVLSGTEAHVRKSDKDFSVERIEATTDPEVYRAMRSGELIGVPQSASPAMRQAHMRLGTNDLHDASLVQAGIRPGVGGAVQINELIARRRGKAFEYEHPDLEDILGLTYGIIVFQEQVDQLLQHFAGYTSGQAEDIRDLIHKKRKEDYGETIREKLIERIVANGYSPVVAERVHKYVAGFKGYGFAQGHALAFAEVSLRSVWMMQNHPAAYFAALLSAQPAGYYGPATIANEARTRGVPILALDVNRSGERFEVEAVEENGMTVPNAAIRVALRQLAGLSSRTRERILEHQAMAVEAEARRPRLPMTSVPRSDRLSVATLEAGGDGDGKGPRILPFRSVFDLALKTQPERDELESLILSGALDSLHPNRRALLWAIPQIQDYARSLDVAGGHPRLPLVMPEPPLNLRVDDFGEEERAVHERALLGLDVAHHLMAFERERIMEKGGVTTAEARRLPTGSEAFVVGNPIRLRFPPTKSGRRVVFFDLEDETGLLNVTCFDDVYMRDGKAIVTSQFATVVGVVQDRDGCPAFLAQRVFPYQPIQLAGRGTLPLKVSDFLVG